MKKILWSLLILMSSTIAFSQSLSQQKITQDAGDEAKKNKSIEIVKNGLIINCDNKVGSYVFYKGISYDITGSRNDSEIVSSLIFTFGITSNNNPYKVESGVIKFKSYNGYGVNEFDIKNNKLYSKKGNLPIEEAKCKRYKDNTANL